MDDALLTWKTMKWTWKMKNRKMSYLWTNGPIY